MVLNFQRPILCLVYLARLRTTRKYFWAIPKKDVIILLPYLGLNNNHITKRVKSCVNRFYSFVIVKVIFQNTLRIKSFFPYEDRLNRSFIKLAAGTAMIFTLGKRSESSTAGKGNISRHFRKMITLLLLLITLKTPVTTSNGTILTFLRLARLITIVRLLQTLFMQDLQPSLKANVSREKVLLY